MTDSTKNNSIDLDNTKIKLINIAFELFNTYGYENVGVRDIASKAGVTTGSFYHHFKSKEDILHKRFGLNEDYLLDILLNKLTSKTYPEKIIEYISVHLAALIINDGYDITGHRLFSKNFREKRSSYLSEAIETLTKNAQSSGEFTTKRTSSEISNIILVSYRGVVYDWFIENGNYDLHKALKEHISIVVEYFSK